MSISASRPVPLSTAPVSLPKSWLALSDPHSQIHRAPASGLTSSSFRIDQLHLMEWPTIWCRYIRSSFPDDVLFVSLVVPPQRFRRKVELLLSSRHQLSVSEFEWTPWRGAYSSGRPGRDHDSHMIQFHSTPLRPSLDPHLMYPSKHLGSDCIDRPRFRSLGYR